MVNCDNCLASISRSRPAISCDACKKQVHAACISSNADILNVLKSVPGLTWKCSNCVNHYISINQEDINKLIDDKLNNVLAEIKNQLTLIKAEVFQTVTDKASSVPPCASQSYSEVARNRTQPAIIIQPKNANQSINQTKADILRVIDPGQEDVQLARVRAVRSGGILVGCKNKEDNDRIKTAIQEKMPGAYQIKEMSGVNPRLRLVGMSVEYSSDILKNLIVSGNTEIFCDNSDCKIIKNFPTKRNRDIYQAVIELNKTAYEKAVRAGHLFVGYDSCCVYDAVDLFRYFKCNDYNHTSQRCQKQLSCPVCSESHEVKQCQASHRKCSNCMKLQVKDNTIAVDHAVWEKDKCVAYSKALDKLKHDLLAPQ